MRQTRLHFLWNSTLIPQKMKGCRQSFNEFRSFFVEFNPNSTKPNSTKAGADGQWMTRVASGAAGPSFPLIIQGKSTVALQNVAVGEMWAAGGQSHMWWHFSDLLTAFFVSPLPRKMVSGNFEIQSRVSFYYLPPSGEFRAIGPF